MVVSTKTSDEFVQTCALLVAVLLFRSKTKFTDLPHVVTAVSLFLDTSVEQTLDTACQFGSVYLLDRIWTAVKPTLTARTLSVMIFGLYGGSCALIHTTSSTNLLSQ